MKVYNKQELLIKLDKITLKELHIQHKDILDEDDVLNILAKCEVYPDYIKEYNYNSSNKTLEVIYYV